MNVWKFFNLSDAEESIAKIDKEMGFPNGGTHTWSYVNFSLDGFYWIPAPDMSPGSISKSIIRGEYDRRTMRRKPSSDIIDKMNYYYKNKFGLIVSDRVIGKPAGVKNGVSNN